VRRGCSVAARMLPRPDGFAHTEQRAVCAQISPASPSRRMACAVHAYKLSPLRTSSVEQHCEIQAPRKAPDKGPPCSSTARCAAPSVAGQSRCLRPIADENSTSGIWRTNPVSTGASRWPTVGRDRLFEVVHHRPGQVRAVALGRRDALPVRPQPRRRPDGTPRRRSSGVAEPIAATSGRR
jgi:hypothetical protein